MASIPAKPRQLDDLREHRAEILAIAARHGATNLSVFGSLARGENSTSSDIDLLVDFEEGRSLLDQLALEQELRTLLGAKVDVASRRGLKPRIRPKVLADALPL
jgi:predicted nucleotidyltransferase